MVDLNAAVSKFVAAMGQRGDEHVQLTAELARHWMPVRLDDGLLDLVLLSLMRNATEAMANGGKVVLRTCGPCLDGLGYRLATEVSVSDSGTGMLPEVAKRAADVSLTNKPHGNSAGLGLWMAHRFASTCGGKGSIETAPGQGTTVKLALPYAGHAGQG